MTCPDTSSKRLAAFWDGFDGTPTDICELTQAEIDRRNAQIDARGEEECGSWDWLEES